MYKLPHIRGGHCQSTPSKIFTMIVIMRLSRDSSSQPLPNSFLHMSQMISNLKSGAIFVYGSC